MTTISVEVPKLSIGQSVEAWRNVYKSAVSSLEEAKQIALLPSYVDRTPGEQEIAKLAAEESTLEKALDTIELMIDGEKSLFTLMKQFCEMEPQDDWQTLFFKLKKLGKEIRRLDCLTL